MALIGSRFQCFFAMTLVCITSSQSIVTVAPTAPIGESTGSNEQYLTLTQYLSNVNVSTVFNTSNLTVEFLPGEHEIDGLPARQMVVSGVSNVVWRGLPDTMPVLKCKQDFAFVCIKKLLT